MSVLKNMKKPATQTVKQLQNSGVNLKFKELGKLVANDLKSSPKPTAQNAAKNFETIKPPLVHLKNIFFPKQNLDDVFATTTKAYGKTTLRGMKTTPVSKVARKVYVEELDGITERIKQNQTISINNCGKLPSSYPKGKKVYTASSKASDPLQEARAPLLVVFKCMPEIQKRYAGNQRNFICRRKTDEPECAPRKRIVTAKCPPIILQQGESYCIKNNGCPKACRYLRKYCCIRGDRVIDEKCRIKTPYPSFLESKYRPPLMFHTSRNDCFCWDPVSPCEEDKRKRQIPSLTKTCSNYFPNCCRWCPWCKTCTYSYHPNCPTCCRD